MKDLSIFWALPFIMTLLAIAICPLAINKIWEKYSFKILMIFPSILAVAISLKYDFGKFLHEFFETMALHYVPLIVLLFALFTVSSGVYIHIQKKITPIVNSLLIFVASLFSGWIGTTGASILFVRPILKLNANRKNISHVVIFFIFLVANIGGGMTPLGDPPLFMGFLEGVDFFWTVKNIGIQVLVSIVVLLSLFFLIDTYLFKKNDSDLLHNNSEKSQDLDKLMKISVDGYFNLFLMICIILTVVLSGMIKSGNLSIFGLEIKFSSIFRDLILMIIGIISLKRTDKKIHEQNDFNFIPLKEVAEIFFVIFITLIPVSYMLKEGSAGAFAGFFNWISENGAINPIKCFCGTGVLSAFLDNAPTYLIFFNLASGNPEILMGDLKNILQAISIAAVFFGAMTYIGNAPNIMVRSIAEQNRVKMPSFLGYIGISSMILLPYFFLLIYICFN